MSKFERVTPSALATNQSFAEYLRQAEIKPAKRGGTFVGNYEIAPDSFRKYGIVLPKGGMIIPDMNPNELCSMVSEDHTRLVADKRSAIAQESERMALSWNEVRKVVVEALDSSGASWLELVEDGWTYSSPAWGSIISSKRDLVEPEWRKVTDSLTQRLQIRRPGFDDRNIGGYGENALWARVAEWRQPETDQQELWVNSELLDNLEHHLSREVAIESVRADIVPKIEALTTASAPNHGGLKVRERSIITTDRGRVNFGALPNNNHNWWVSGKGRCFVHLYDEEWPVEISHSGLQKLEDFIAKLEVLAEESRVNPVPAETVVQVASGVLNK